MLPKLRATGAALEEKLKSRATVDQAEVHGFVAPPLKKVEPEASKPALEPAPVIKPQLRKVEPEPSKPAPEPAPLVKPQLKQVETKVGTGPTTAAQIDFRGTLKQTK
jgi:hypothetical protein